MADLTNTITDRINLLGIQPSNKWNAMVWGTDTWGAGSNDEIQDVGKYMANTLTLSAENFMSPFKTFSNSFSLTDMVGPITLMDRNGYFHIFPGGSTDLDDALFPSWGAISGNTPSYTKLTASSTSWVNV